MKSIFHKKITSEMLSPYFSPGAMTYIINANLRQDSILGQLLHNEFHFDNNKLREGYAYISQQQYLTIEFLTKGKPKKAWQALGRLMHTVQDFYAHSNYIALWVDSLQGKAPNIDDLTFNDAAIVTHPVFHTHKVYFPLDFVGIMPGMSKIVKKYLPSDSHAHMNLDSPESGDLFPWAYQAASKRTYHEFITLLDRIKQIDHDLVNAFLDREWHDN